MELSIFFAKLFGLYLLIMSLFMLLRKKNVEVIAKELFASKGILYFAGALNLFLGLAIVISHPVWEWNWRGLITLLGCLFILKGIMRVGFPEQTRVIEPKMMRGYWIIFAVVALIGIYLTYSGFSALSK